MIPHLADSCQPLRGQPLHGQRTSYQTFNIPDEIAVLKKFTTTSDGRPGMICGSMPNGKIRLNTLQAPAVSGLVLSLGTDMSPVGVSSTFVIVPIAGNAPSVPVISARIAQTNACTPGSCAGTVTWYPVSEDVLVDNSLRAIAEPSPQSSD